MREESWTPRPFILLGYGSVQKGYRVFNSVSEKVSYSRNFKSDEQEAERPPVEEPAQQLLVLDFIVGSESDHEGVDEEPEQDDTDGEPPAVEVEPRSST